MINLRFHIVSITAVFLALAIGIFMGTSLLQRATVDSLQAGQRSLETKIEQRQRENTAYRDALASEDSAEADFAQDALPMVITDRLDGSILVVASRGIAEDALGEVVASVEEAGAAVVGTLWTDERSALEDESMRESVATALGTPTGQAAALRRRVAEALADALDASLTRSPEAPEVTPTTLTPGTLEDPATEPLATITALSETGVVTWEPAADGPGFPTDGLRVLVVSGEGATTDEAKVLHPLLRALGTDRPGVVLAGEVMDDRSSIVEIERELDDQLPPRGAFVGPIRGDALREDVATIDNLDSPYGRLALVLSLARPPGDAVGAYGITAGADSQYPSRTP